MHVVDASVAAALFVGDERHASAAARVFTQDTDLWAPHLLDAEVGHALRRAVLAGLVDPAVAAASLEDLLALPMLRVPHGELLERAWGLRDNVSFYDGLYVALAERLGAVLLTFDERLARAAAPLIDVRAPAAAGR